ncbi:COG1361 S-layer family protein [Candidatus Woesearchaeota archaeon]|nr:COG1361 S-layer family protein [Candidatus Woesearchaeota archaeon]
MRKYNIMIMALVVIVSSMLITISTAYADESNSDILIVSLVNQDPDPAVAGDVVEVRVGIENIGGAAAEDVVLEFVPQYPFSTIADEDYTKEVGTLKAHQQEADMRIVKFKVRVDRDATAGEYQLKINTYEDGSADAKTRILSIDVKNSESAEVIHIDKTTLVPGKQTPLKFIINNVGNAPLKDMTFSWLNEDKIVLPVGSDNTKYVKYIDVGESAELEYQVIADSNADAGLYELDLSLSYEDPISGESKEMDTIAGVYVGGGTDFDIAFSESSSGQTSFTIANVGSNPAFSVSVTIPEQERWKVSGSNSMIIGNLNTGDYTVASFSLHSQATMPATMMQQEGMDNAEQEISREEMIAQRKNAQQDTSLKILIVYTDTMGNREEIKKEVAINLQTMMGSSTDSESTATQADMASFRDRRIQQGFFSKYKWYIAGLLVLAVLVGAYIRYKKERLDNPNYRFMEVFMPKKKRNIK